LWEQNLKDKQCKFYKTQTEGHKKVVELEDDVVKSRCEIEHSKTLQKNVKKLFTQKPWHRCNNLLWKNNHLSIMLSSNNTNNEASTKRQTNDKSIGDTNQVITNNTMWTKMHMNSWKERGLANYYGKIKSWWREIVLKNVWNKLLSMHNVNVW